MLLRNFLLAFIISGRRKNSEKQDTNYRFYFKNFTTPNMKSKVALIILLFSALLSICWKTLEPNWINQQRGKYTLYYTPSDAKNIKIYSAMFNRSTHAVEKFCGTKLKQHFDIYVHPTRQSLDSTWQADWSMPGFTSECWMVASGVAKKLDIISPKLWDEISCEHKYGNKTETQQLITHEIFHVFHGQVNKSSDFSDTDGIDWFVEGFATYASGQCNANRIAQVKKAISNKTCPNTLNDFWKGNLKYGLSGSVVMFIDKQYGRKKLLQLLPHNKKSKILQSLQLTEDELIANWKQYLAGLP